MSNWDSEKKHAVVPHQSWLEARQELLVKEKELSRLREEMTQLRRGLPWERVEKSYRFEGPEGQESLEDLFGNCSQLIVYHFMFGSGWPEGCKVCSMIGDHYDPLIVHLQSRDVSLVSISRAPFEELARFKQRMGWSFKWVSSCGNDFNRDYHVSFTQEELDSNEVFYNYQQGFKFPVTEGPGVSVFARDGNGDVFHTYSAYARGLENLLGIYNFLDLVPKGRDEATLPYSMAWVRHKDRYGDDTFVDPYL